MLITKPTLLIVDDDAAIRNTLTLIFVELGYSVRSASDGFAALALIHESMPDVLLSDLQMPGMSGFELLSVVRRIHPNIRVVATSGAFHGKAVPPGVSADGFYEKASGLSYLLDLVRRSPNPDSTLRRPSSELEPIWITPSGRLPSKEVYLLMGCPRCLRAFLEVVGDGSGMIRETDCLHCHNTITYAIVPMAEPVPSINLLGTAQDVEVAALADRRRSHQATILGSI